ncbi:hypothetical protein ACJDT4_20020 [Clostridium neuense]|uniref:Uncharacterized protein n=1 Tax=Clostridium neuense TaxID=1728934 RepID=A0ABW8TKE7_9CLOT
MKRITKIIIWILISLTLQSAVLLYFNNFRVNKKVTYKKIDIPARKKSDMKVSIPSGAYNIKVSSTGKFVSYYLKNSIHVIEMDTGKDNSINLEVPVADTSISWRASDDKLMVIERKYSSIKVYTYSPKENNMKRNLNMKNEAEAYPVGSSYRITGIEQNNKNTLIYLKVTQNGSGNYSLLKKLDISTGIKELQLPIHNIGNYYIFKSENTIVFEDEVDKKVYMRSNNGYNQKLQVPQVTNSKLLGVDDNGMVYIGKLVNNKVSQVYTCNISTGNAEGTGGSNSEKKAHMLNTFKGNWSTISLKESIQPKNIYVSDTGGLYTIDSQKGVVSNVKTAKKYSFKGTYVCMFGDNSDGGIISLSDGKIIETMI